MCQANLQDYDRAIETLSRAPDDYNTAFYLGICHLNRQEHGTAASYFERALERGPNKEDIGRIMFYAGFCHKSAGDYERAIEVLTEALRFDQGLEINNLLGICHFKLKNYGDALRHFKAAVDIDPFSAIDHANICACLKELGELEEAAGYCRSALELDPSIDFARDILDGLEKAAKGSPDKDLPGHAM